MRKLIGGLSVLVLAAAVARAGNAPPLQTNGTFFKGSAVGGRDVFNHKGSVLNITGEQASGSMDGEPFTGSVAYTIEEEIVFFLKQDGWFHATMVISKPTGETITVRLDGKSTGIDPNVSPTLNVNGTWRVMSGTGQYKSLSGSGTFTGVEQWADGTTNGNFSGTASMR